MTYPLFISCPRNMEYLLADELTALGLKLTKTSPLGVYGDADLKTLYNLCLWTRLANRVQLLLFNGKFNDTKQLYQLCRDYQWSTLFDVDKTIAIEFHGEGHGIKNSMYGAQLVKDAVVDYFQDLFDKRPSVDKEHPNIRLHARIKHNQLTVSLDLVGHSLHQRGYRYQTGGAPLKENLAAALLIRSKWPELAAQNYAFIDPFCGSGTLLIEAALMASNTAPGLLRNDQAFKYWRGHDEDLWQQLRTEAKSQQKPIQNKITGYDSSYKIIDMARNNITAAQLHETITVKQQAIKDLQPQDGQGLVVCNPPYGERLKDAETLKPLYQDLGERLAKCCSDWQAAVLTTDADLAHAIGLRHDKKYQFFNGNLAVTLYTYQLNEKNQFRADSKKPMNHRQQSLLNRLIKNQKKLKPWLKKNNISCYRLYDADLPEYAFAIDIYNDWVHAQEYAAPKTIPEKKAALHANEFLQVLPEALNISKNKIIIKQRQRQKGKQQYQSFADKKQTMMANEGPAKLLVNLQDYLDTGLFLDYRQLRLQFSDKKPGKRFLNLFCYTAAFSVHAALAGAMTTNIDMSKTYLDWAVDNFKVNKLALKRHQFIQADCLQWLKQCTEKFDAIFLDPPSFSNSKRMQTTLDIQRDHVKLIDMAMRCLSPDGTLYFSNNFKKFKLDDCLKEKYFVEDITDQTIDEDFKRSKNIHHCFVIRYLLAK